MSVDFFSPQKKSSQYSLCEREEENKKRFTATKMWHTNWRNCIEWPIKSIVFSCKKRAKKKIPWKCAEFSIKVMASRKAMQTNWTRIALPYAMKTKEKRERKNRRTILRFKSSARRWTESWKKKTKKIRTKSKTTRAWNKSTTNITTIKQVSVKRTIVFCFGALSVPLQLLLVLAVHRKLIHFLHVGVCTSLDLYFIALNGCASANYCALPARCALSLSLCRSAPPALAVLLCSSVRRFGDETIAIIVEQLTSLINVSRAHGCTLHSRNQVGVPFRAFSLLASLTRTPTPSGTSSEMKDQRRNVRTNPKCI